MASKTSQCPNCGAPLEIPKDATDIACKYCGTPVHIERTRKPPPPEQVKPQTVYVKPGLPGFVLWIIILAGVLPAFIPIFIFAGPALFKVFSSRYGDLPMTCAMNEELEIEGKTFSGTGTLIVAELNCKLTIKDSKLSGDVVLENKGNLELTVENSTLEGKDVGLKLENNSKVVLAKGSVLKSPELAVSGSTNVELKVDGSSIEAGSHGVELGVNGKVWLLHKSKATAEGPVIAGETNLEVTVDDSTLDSKDVAIAGNLNAKLKLTRGARVHGARTAIRTGGNMNLSIENSTVASEGTAICSAYNTDITGSHATVSGGVEAVRFQRKPDTFDFRDSHVQGAQVFESEGCGGGGVGAAATVEAAKPPMAIDPRTMFKNLPKGVSRIPLPSPTPTAPAPAPAAPPFDSDAAARALDAAARSASASCRSSKGKPEKAWVNPGFSPDGVNRGAVVGIELRGTPEEACILRIFQAVRIPPFDPATRPSGLGRAVDLK